MSLQPSPWQFVETSVSNAPQAPIMTILRPFLMLASVAFVTGFAGYLAAARVTAFEPQPAYSEAANPSAAWVPAASIDDANVGKHT